jgi:hypothetical protein
VSFNYTLNGEELVVEEGTTAIPDFAFRQNNLFLTAIFPSTLETIGRFAFDETSLTEANLPNSLVTLEHGAFRRSDLTELVLPDSVVTIGDQAFDGSDLASVQLSDSLTSIGDYAFYNTSLTQVTIPESVQSIGQGAFAATNIQSVVVPASFAGNLPTDAFNLGTEITLSAESTTPPEPPVEAAVEAVTEEPTSPPVEAAVEAVTEEPTSPPVEAAVEAVTEEPTSPPVEAAVEVVIDAPTPPPVEAAAEVVTDEPIAEPSAPRSAGSPAASTSSSSSAPSLRSAFEGLGAINQVVDSVQRVVDEVIQVGKSVIPSSSAEISVPEKFVDRLSVVEESAEKIALNAASRVKNLDLEMQVPGLLLDVKKVANSDIVFTSGLNAEFVSAVKKMKNVSIAMFQGDDVVRFTDGVIKKSSVSTGQGDDLITLGEDVTVGKKTTFLLGQGSDQVKIQGAIKKLKIDLGDDVSSDTVKLAAEDLISKKLKISNFNRGDKLILDGDVFTYADLRDNDLDRIKIGFGEASVVDQVIDSLGVDRLLDSL